MKDEQSAFAPWQAAIGRLDASSTILFSADELRCKGSGLLELDPRFAAELSRLRMAFGRPMPVSSCCRSKEHNAAIGGHPRSLHVGGAGRYYAEALAGAAAIDVVYADVNKLWALVRSAQELGWSFGLRRCAGGHMIHLDRRELVGLPRGAFGY